MLVCRAQGCHMSPSMAHGAGLYTAYGSGVRGARNLARAPARGRFPAYSRSAGLLPYRWWSSFPRGHRTRTTWIKESEKRPPAPRIRLPAMPCAPVSVRRIQASPLLERLRARASVRCQVKGCVARKSDTIDTSVECASVPEVSRLTISIPTCTAGYHR